MATPRRVRVAVVGGGLAGLATSLRLARRGHDVVCLEPRPWPRPGVGESLEFSAPALLADLGLPVEGPEAAPALFPKTVVEITAGDGTELSVWPPAWFAAPPLRCSGRTFHTDRTELDARVHELAAEAGVEFLAERVVELERDGDRIVQLVTDRGRRLEPGWVVDASGHTARVVARAMGVERDLLGDRRLAHWTRVATPPLDHATRLHFPEPAATGLTWVWEIPLNEREVSVGVVVPADRARSPSGRGGRGNDALRRHVAPFPRLRRLVAAHPEAPVTSTAFTPFRHRRCVGANWVLVGDAAAMVDPLTSNGVTSALRHAALAADLVDDAIAAGRLPPDQARAYERTAPAVVATLDLAIETLLHDHGIRRRIGIAGAARLYAATGVITNSLYAALRPTGARRSRCVAATLALARLWVWVASRALRLVVAPRPAPPRPRRR